MSESEDNDGNVMTSAKAEVEVNLQDIIQDRKVERKLMAEEKRQMDLQRIKDMKSTTGIDPLQRFPKEIWEMILDELDPMDRGNAYQVHPMFRDLLEKNKIRDTLFPKVINLKNFQECHDDEYEPENYCSLRRVSKVMRNSVDQMAEDNLRKTIHTRGTIFSDGRFTSAYLCFDSSEEKEDVKRIISCFQGKGKKRFFVKTVNVCFPWLLFNDDDEEDEEQIDEQRLRLMFKEFQNDVTALLELIGDQILHFCLDMPHRAGMDPSRLIVSLDEVYMLLQRCTMLMPNLEWLELELRTRCPGEEISPSVLEKYLFPHLASLERVTFEYGQVTGQSLTPEICKAILKANQHIKILYFDEVEDCELPLLPMHLIQSLPLTSFSVVNSTNLQLAQSSELRLTFQSIQPMINLNWKLKAFKLELSDPDVSLSELLKLVQNFPTLEYLSLDFRYGVKIGYNGNFDYLRLSNLTDLQLRLSNPDINYENGNNVHFFFSLQFLLLCGKLKTLGWELWFFDDCKLRKHLKSQEYQSRGKTLDFRAGLRTLYDSNIWDVFLYLRTVRVEGLKSGYGDSDIEVVRCSHGYRREEIADGKSVGDFLKEHKCCRHENQLHNCVMLFG